MKTAGFLFLLIVTMSIHSRGQDIQFATSNYAGVSGVGLQPASIADSRHKFDLTISSTQASFYNNYFSIDPYVFWHPELFSDLGNWEDLNYIERNTSAEDKTFQFAFQQELMGFMLTLSDKDAIAFTPKARLILNVDHMSEPLARLMDNELKVEDLWFTKLSNANLSIQANSWIDYGITYARVLKGEGKHFLKAGATVKFSQGLGSMYMFAHDINYQFNTDDSLTLFQSYVSYGASDNIYQLEDNTYKYRFLANPSLTFDFGLVYEFRPKWKEFKYDMDGKSNLWRRDKNKYLFKVGISITDLGQIHYRRTELSRDFNANIDSWYIGGLNFESVQSFNDTLHKYFTFYDIPTKYNMNLPTAVCLQADVNIWKGFYLNFIPYFALNRGNKDVNKVHYYSSYTVIPRFDSKWFGLSVPVQYTSLKQTNIGLGARLGPFWFGSNDIISYLASGNYRYGASFSMAMKFPIYYRRPHDRDGDQVSDRKDRCPETPGILAMKGCPDTDGDGIEDADDKCINTPGLKEFMGCPDSDSDGITDDNDQCPDIKGLLAFNGCPDSDGDSIIDSKDDCPFNAGSALMNGCPDQDGDGIADKDDQCPTVPGTRENQGCPFFDNDGDGVKDNEDHCPGIKGPVENFGCPYADSDNDGIADKDDECPSIAGIVAFRGCPDSDSDGISDKYDLCPTLAGVPANNGCPEIQKAEQEIIDKAFANLEFESGKSLIKKSSTGSLDELAALLINKPEFKLLISGHTDNVGNPESNLNLSRNRTLAVKDYLVKKGVAPERIRTEHFGQTRPIADNTTAEGRQKNRRVEMKIVFD